mmetsp:Transcript_36077/g.57693  ORF Transcript_36077/g.57693 Transcript_36077/m.57693 type:complete len:295 (-) Transcript_36077:98-982(-)
MGNVCAAKATVYTDEAVDDEPTDRALESAVQNPEEIKALIVYVDYGFEPAKSSGWCPPAFGAKLDTPENANMIYQLLTGAGVQPSNIWYCANLKATKDSVTNAIAQIGEMADENDTFFFFYSGHGASKQDCSGDEADGMDECLCLPDPYGNVNEGTFLTDDEFSAAVAQVQCGQKLIVMDCCHSGSMLDFNKSYWWGQKAISLCGCKDPEEAAAFGGGTRGGAFTKMVYHAAMDYAGMDVTVAHIYNQLWAHHSEMVPPGRQQHMEMQCAPGFAPNNMMWPLKQTQEQQTAGFA